MAGMASALLVATMDTKGSEALYMEDCFKEAGVNAVLMDVGIMGQSPIPVTVSREDVARAAGKSLAEVQTLGHEGEALAIMTTGAIQCAQALYKENRVQGVIGLGGSMGTTISTAIMRSFPLGFPKVMISTMASRNTRPFVGTKDILMLHSVCDISGLNRITRKILQNGVIALAGMIKNARAHQAPGKPLVILSTLGTTEICARAIHKALEEKCYEVVIFHTVGSGGEAMEEMIRSERPEIVIDLSLHELADHRFGGDYDAGPERGSAALQLGIRTIMIPGNIDFLATGPLAHAQQQFPGRMYHVHNAAITCVRTTREEIEILATTIARFSNEAKGPLALLVPMKGFSAFDRPGGPLYDPEAPRLFSEIFKKEHHSRADVHFLPYHVNDKEFAMKIMEAFERVLTQ